MPPPVKERIESEPETVKENDNPPKKDESKETGESSNAHKWIIAATVLVVLVFIAFYFGTSSNPVETQEEVSKPKLIIDNSILSEYLEEARIENGALKGVVLPTWNQLLDDQKKDLMKQMLRLGGQKGYNKVQLVDKSNKTVASAEEGNIQVLE